jgi:hypothetical protein
MRINDTLIPAHRLTVMRTPVQLGSSVLLSTCNARQSSLITLKVCLGSALTAKECPD